MTGERRGFRRNAFHHAAVAAEGVHVVVEHLEIRPVEIAGHPAAGHRHADARRHALSERPGRRLDARRPSIFRMAGASAVELPESLDVVERHGQMPEPFVLRVHRLDAGEVEHRVQQHRRMADRQDEPIAIGPDRIVRIESELPLPERVHDWRHRHRSSRVPRVRLLYCIHRQRPDRVHGELVQILRVH